MTCLDTTFLIDLQREMEAGRPGPAARWIQENGEEEAGISAVAWGVDRFLDMCRTSVNVTGDLVIAAVTDRLSGSRVKG